MEPVASVVERLKTFAKSSEELVRGALRRRAVDDAGDARRRNNNPIEILKRLQREAFSELMKLRERQEKVEHILSSYKTAKGSPFQEVSTHMKGVVNVVGALFFMGNDSQQTGDTLNRAGIRSGIDSRFIFETVVRQKDALIAEFVASQSSLGSHSDVPGSPLALSKVMYLANINDWLSLISIPLGARCKDFGIGLNLLQGLTEISSYGPPLLNQCHGCAAGLSIKGSNFSGSIAELVPGLGMQPFFALRRCLGTFGQVDYRPFEGTKVTLLGFWQMSKSTSQQIRSGMLVIPMDALERHTISETAVEQSSLSIARNSTDNVSSGSIALMLESELDESSRIGGWIEMHKSSSKNLQWALSLSDTPEDEVGWGLSVGGTIEGHLSRVQVEGFLKLSLGKRFSLQPGVVYAMEGSTQFPALMIRSSWSL